MRLVANSAAVAGRSPSRPRSASKARQQTSPPQPPPPLGTVTAEARSSSRPQQQEPNGTASGPQLSQPQPAQAPAQQQQQKQHAQPVRPFAALPSIPQTPPRGSSHSMSTNPTAVATLGAESATKQTLKLSGVGYVAVHPEIKPHRHLTRLHLNNNALSSLPDALFSQCPNLVFLDISDNKLGPQLPLAISRCRSLRELYALGNQIVDIEPPLLQPAAAQRQLLFGGLFDEPASTTPAATGASAAGAGPDVGLRGLEHLEVLDLRRNKLTGLPVDLFAKLRRLRALLLSDNPLKALPPSLGLLMWRDSAAASAANARLTDSPDPNSAADAVGGVLTWLSLDGATAKFDPNLRRLADALVAANGLVAPRVNAHFFDRRNLGGGPVTPGATPGTLERRGSRPVTAGGAPSAVDVLYLGVPPPPLPPPGYQHGVRPLSDAEDEVAVAPLGWLDYGASPVVKPPEVDFYPIEPPTLLRKRKSNPEARSPLVTESPVIGYFTLHRRNSNDSMMSVAAPSSPLFSKEGSPWSSAANPTSSAVSSHGSSGGGSGSGGGGIRNPADNHPLLNPTQPAAAVVPLSQLHPGFLHLQRLLSHLRDLHDLDPRTVLETRMRRTASALSFRKSSAALIGAGGDADTRHAAAAAAASAGDDPDAPGLTDAERERIRKRQSPSRRAHIANEVLSTERTYVRELQALDDVYVSPLEPGGSARDILSQVDLNLLFANVKSILGLHKSYILPKLEEALANPNQPIGAVFAEAAPTLRMYSSYYNNFDNANAFVAQFEQVLQSSTAFRAFANTTVPAHLLQASSLSPALSASSRRATARRLRNFLKAAKSHPSHSQISLQAYLILPVQRLPRYKLLLDQLLESTPPSHPDRADLASAAQLIRTVVAECNDMKREQEQRERTQMVLARIRVRPAAPPPAGAAAAASISAETGALEGRLLRGDRNRRFVREGTLRVVKLVERAQFLLPASAAVASASTSPSSPPTPTPRTDVWLTVASGRRDRVFQSPVGGLVETRFEMDWVPSPVAAPPLGVLDNASLPAGAAAAANAFLYTRHASSSGLPDPTSAAASAALQPYLLAAAHLKPSQSFDGASPAFPNPFAASRITLPTSPASPSPSPSPEQQLVQQQQQQQQPPPIPAPVLDPLAVNGLQLTTGRDVRIFLFSDAVCICAETPVADSAAQQAQQQQQPPDSIHLLVRTLGVGVAPTAAAGAASTAPAVPILSVELLPLPFAAAGLITPQPLMPPLPPLPPPQPTTPRLLAGAIRRSPWNLRSSGGGASPMLPSSPLAAAAASFSATPAGSPLAAPSMLLAGPAASASPSLPSSLLAPAASASAAAAAAAAASAPSPATSAATATAAATSPPPPPSPSPSPALAAAAPRRSGPEGLLRLADGDSVVYLRGFIDDLEDWAQALAGLQRTD